MMKAETNDLEDSARQISTSTVDLSHPVVLERHGQPMAVVISIEEYKHYQTLLAQEKRLSASEARQAADRAVFGDLVGCALDSGEPIWSPLPEPHWRVPYRFFDGTLLKIVAVDARTGVVALADEERRSLLEQVEHMATVDVST